MLSIFTGNGPKKLPKALSVSNTHHTTQHCLSDCWVLYLGGTWKLNIHTYIIYLSEYMYDIGIYIIFIVYIMFSYIDEASGR